MSIGRMFPYGLAVGETNPPLLSRSVTNGMSVVDSHGMTMPVYFNTTADPLCGGSNDLTQTGQFASYCLRVESGKTVTLSITARVEKQNPGYDRGTFTLEAVSGGSAQCSVQSTSSGGGCTTEQKNASATWVSDGSKFYVHGSVTTGDGRYNAGIYWSFDISVS